MSTQLPKKRGLASASEETRKRVAQSGGHASHEKRGLQGADQLTRSRVARAGGIARGAQTRELRDRTEETESGQTP